VSKREFYEERGQAFYDRYYGQLEGATINRYLGMRDGFPVFELLMDDGAHGYIAEIEVSQDPEGNGGGFLFGLNQPDMSDWIAKEAELNAVNI
jgi:hypothetical protein